MHPHLPPRPYLTKGESRRTCGDSGGGPPAGAAAERSRGACMLGATEVDFEQLSRTMAMDFPVSPVNRLPIFPNEAASAAALMEIRGDSACSEGEAGNVYVLDEEAAGHGQNAVSA